MEHDNALLVERGLGSLERFWDYKTAEQIRDLSDEQRVALQHVRRILAGNLDRYPAIPCDMMQGQVFLADASFILKTDAMVMREKYGFTHVLNCAGQEVGTTAEQYAPAEIKLMVLDAKDVHGYDMMTHAEAAIAFIDECVRAGGKAAVHCVAGVNRSGCMVVAYLLWKTRQPLLQTIKQAREARGPILTNASFQVQIVKYASELGVDLRETPPL
ncbi:Dual specificity protein phosphatase 26 [Porphyridium purpureum]|uniref:protein-serine/threonine phosphatase n=1 Tax=Porphyridium purpureum TaxID=35688 RepID=A0A5J4Z3Z1_PORPP|nr:Dual specificity protein phosphatase 26 [Porphyridium purpureum]|eukprot:POR0636..scf295_1